MSASIPLDPGVPSSKSIVQRTLLAAALARGTTRIRAPERCVGADVAAAKAWVGDFGARVVEGSELAITGLGPRGPKGRSFDVGESGTLWRCGLSVLALSGSTGTFRLRRRGTLARRASPALLSALREAGATIEHAAADDVVRPCAPPALLELFEPSSSQEVSGLLMALARTGAPHELRVRGPLPSRPYVALTLRVLASFGARVETTACETGVRYRVRGPLVAPSEPCSVEPDASAAAVALAAGAIVDRAVRVPGLGPDAMQGDVAFTDQLRAFGADVALDERGWTVRGTVDRPVRLDLTDTPDLAPVCAALGAVVALRAIDSAPTELVGLETLPGKESSRIAVLAAGLRTLGLAVEDDERSLALRPDPSRRGVVGPLELAVAGDHRMVFAFALIGLARAGLRTDEPGAVAKSWPGFWAFEGRLRAATA